MKCLCFVAQFSTWSKMRVSTLPSAGGLDVNELSNKLATIPVLKEEAEGEGEREEDEEDGVQMLDEVALSDSSSTAAMFGSETGGRKWGGGMCVCVCGGGGGGGGVRERGSKHPLTDLCVCVCADRGGNGGSVFDSFAPSSRSSKRVSNVGE